MLKRLFDNFLWINLVHNTKPNFTRIDMSLLPRFRVVTFQRKIQARLQEDSSWRNSPTQRSTSKRTHRRFFIFHINWSSMAHIFERSGFLFLQIYQLDVLLSYGSNWVHSVVAHLHCFSLFFHNISITTTILPRTHLKVIILSTRLYLLTYHETVVCHLGFNRLFGLQRIDFCKVVSPVIGSDCAVEGLRRNF